MIIADLHNDTAFELYYKKAHLKENKLNIDLKKQSFSKNLLFYAIYMEPEKYGNDKWRYFLNIYDYFLNEINKNNEEIKLFEGTDDFLQGNKHNALLTLEGGTLIESLSDIKRLFDLKIRLITLTWNESDRLASSCADFHDGGLTDFGKEALSYMESLGIIADLSHSSDKTFFDVMKYAKMPVCVSHSNSRALKNVKRNITDEMFCALLENNGLLGINFYSEFLGDNASVHDIIKHIEHFLTLGGENNIAFGSDFDGVSALPRGVCDFTSYNDIYTLLNSVFGEATAEKITYKNVLRFLQKRA